MSKLQALVPQVGGSITGPRVTYKWFLSVDGEIVLSGTCASERDASLTLRVQAAKYAKEHKMRVGELLYGSRNQARKR